MIEVDFLWVGEERRTGDAICVRFTDPSTGKAAVIVIDGGFADTGTRIIELVTRYYGTTRVDLMICTHPDDDHIYGLRDVFDGLTVDRLLIHRPVLHGYGDDDHKSPLVEDLVTTALKHGTSVSEPFTGDTYFGGALTIVGPSLADYEELLAQEAEAGTTRDSLTKAILAAAAARVGRTLQKLFGDPGETLTGDNGGTTPRNNTSVITHLAVDGRRLLFTGDAGAPALSAAADYMDALGVSTSHLDFFDIPHHGSRHNLTKDLCDRLLGTVVSNERRGSAYVSVGKKADDFPRPEIANACRRRGYPVFATRGQNIWWGRGAPARADYTSIEPIEWLDETT